METLPTPEYGHNSPEIQADMQRYIEEVLPILGYRDKLVGAELKGLGWSFGSNIGLFCTVYRSPCKKYALKVSNGRYDSYSYYATTAMNYQHNPYFPRVYWHINLCKCVEFEAHRRHITIMEWLDEDNREEHDERGKLRLVLSENKPRDVHDPYLLELAKELLHLKSTYRDMDGDEIGFDILSEAIQQP